MNITLLQENLAKAVSKTARIISQRTQLPVLQNLLLSTEDGRLRVTASNLETTESAWVGAKIEKEGGLCVPARTLADLVLSLPQEPVHMIVHEASLRVSCGGAQATIPGVAAGEFPPVSKPKKGKALKIETETLAAALSHTLFAAATDEGRPLLTGVKIVSRDKKLWFVATDGYRLSLQKASVDVPHDIDLVVPARALVEVVKACQEEKERKELQLLFADDGQLLITVGDTEITTRLISGEYPDFEKIIPASFSTRALADKQQFARAVKSAAIFARDNANIVRLHIENQRLVVSANTPAVGENTVDVDAKIDGEGGDIAFNSRFLTEFLSNFTEEELLFEMTGALNPGVFRPVKDDSFLHLIMPVRVQA